ncbi:MAG: hypothetical protein ABIK96_09070 [bacterium]
MAAVLVIAFLLSGVAAASSPPFIHFHFESEGGRAAALKCGEIWRAEGPRLAALIPAGVRADTVHCLVLNTEEFTQRFGDRLPDWGVGVALGGGLVALDYARMPAVGRGIREVFLHEMTHAILFQAAGEAWLPAWFHEGTAMQLSGEWRFSDTVSLILDGRVPDLARLQGRWPGLDTRADRAYRASLLGIQRLMTRFGPDVVPRILAATRETGDFAGGFLTATGETPATFTEDFAAAMRHRYGWITILTRWPGLFVIMALVLVIGAVRKIFLTRRRLAAMDDEDFSPPEY